MDLLFEPFSHAFISTAIGLATLTGLLTGLLSAFLVLKGWSLIGDSLSHAIIPGVAGAYLLALPFSLGAFFSGALAASAMVLLNQTTALRQDAIIGLVFTSFFALGLFIASLFPISVNLTAIISGNILGISYTDTIQILVISAFSLGIVWLKWRDFMLIFFDETYAASLGLNVLGLKILFFTILAATTVAAMQTVGAFLVVALVITPGATAYLLVDRTGALCLLSGSIGALTAGLGVYISYFVEIVPGPSIIVLQTLIFIVVLIFAPRHGLIAQQKLGS